MSEQSTTSLARDEMSSVGRDAKQQAAGVGQEARHQVQSVAGEARQQAQQVLSTATSELETQLGQRLQSSTGAARSRAGELRALADGRVEEAGQVRDWAQQAAERLERVADRAEQLGPRGVAEEVADLARRRPVAFLVGAAAAGFAVGRLGRAGKQVLDEVQELEQAGQRSSPTTPDIDLTGPAQGPPANEAGPVVGTPVAAGRVASREVGY